MASCSASMVHHQPLGCRPKLSHQETRVAVFGVVFIIALQDQASVDTLLHLSFDLISLLFRSQVGTPTYLVTHKLRFQLEVHVDQLVTGGWRG